MSSTRTETASTPTTAVETSLPVATAPIVVATDGTPQADGALVMAGALAGRLGARVRVLSVHAPVAELVPEAQLLLDLDVAASLRADLARRVQSQCARCSDGEAEGALDDAEVRDGDPARVIARVSAEYGAQLVVVGIGRRDLIDRMFGDEMALKVVRSCRAPVLAVPADRRLVPRRAIVAVDFSDGSVRAAQTALRLLTDGGMVQLVHVMPQGRLLLDAWIVSREEYRRFARNSFARMVSRLDVPPGVAIEEVTLEGSPAAELLRYATVSGADLIAAGSHGHDFVASVVVGSVTTKLLRGAECAVLVVPPDAFLDAPELCESGIPQRVAPSEWSSALDAFTRANVGRRARLEVDDPEIDHPLLGVAFDPRDRRVDILLGRLGSGEQHVSRSIGGVESLDVLTDDDGKEIALRVRHREGQIILTLVP